MSELSDYKRLVLTPLIAKKDAEIARPRLALAELLSAAQELRSAQRAYMADRGNETLGKAVGAAATALDAAIAKATNI